MYTKGPWLLHKFDPSTIVDASGRTSDASHLAYVCEEKENWGDEWDGDWRDNARLIAAAPELLEAARQALSDLEWVEKQKAGTNMQASILILRAAIAKATGK